MKTEAQIQKIIEKLSKWPELQPRYLKNLVVDVCHAQSETAKTELCNICFRGVTARERKKMDGYSFGFPFAQIYNKRHKKENSWKVYFSGFYCLDCLSKLETQLNHKFVKSFAP